MLNAIFGSLPPDPHWVKPLINPSTGTSWMYPICILLGFVVAITLGCLKLWKRYKVSTEPFYWFILIGVPCAILGARFGSCAIGQTPWDQFFVKFGSGLAIEWGVMLTVIVAFIYFPLVLKRPRYRVRDTFGDLPDEQVKRVSMWMYFDAIIPAILIAQFIGRWGNYCNQEVYGAPVSDEGLANFLYKCLPGMFINGEWKQPLFFWEGLGNLVMFFVLYFGIEFVKQRKTGDLAGAYFVWYGVFRAALEPLRDHQFGFQVSIVTSIVWAAIGILFIVFNHCVLAKVRDDKVWRALWNFGPIEPFRMIKKEWFKWIINFHSNKVKKLNKHKELSIKAISSTKNDANLQKINQIKISELDKKIDLYEKSIKTRETNLEKYLNQQKDKRAKKISKSYNEILNNLKSKSNKLQSELSKSLDDKVRIKKQMKLNEINKEILDFKSKSVDVRQAEYERRYQDCIRKPNELIYYGAW